MWSSCFNTVNNFRGGFGGYGGFGDFNPMWMMGFGILRLLVLGLILFLVIRYLVPRLKRPETPVHLSGAGDSALKILSERYARGEIDSDTYQTMKENLTK